MVTTAPGAMSDCKKIAIAKKASEAKLLVQCIAIHEDVEIIETIMPSLQAEARQIFHIIKIDQVISHIGNL